MKRREREGAFLLKKGALQLDTKVQDSDRKWGRGNSALQTFEVRSCWKAPLLKAGVHPICWASLRSCIAGKDLFCFSPPGSGVSLPKVTFVLTDWLI